MQLSTPLFARMPAKKKSNEKKKQIRMQREAAALENLEREADDGSHLRATDLDVPEDIKEDMKNMRVVDMSAPPPAPNVTVELGDSKENIKKLEAELKRNPGSCSTSYQLGGLYYRSGLFPQAAHHLSRANESLGTSKEQTKPSQFDVLFTLGKAFKEIPECLTMAESAFIQAGKLRPDDEQCKDEYLQVKKVLDANEVNDTMTIVVQEGHRGGDTIDVRMPNGNISRFALPDGAKPGDKVKIQIPDESEIIGEQVITIPENAKAGDELARTLPNGEVVKYTIPDGAKPGDQIALPSPFLSNEEMLAQEETILTVPEGAEGGDVIDIKMPNGELLKYTLPDGVKAGERFKVKTTKVGR